MQKNRLLSLCLIFVVLSLVFSLPLILFVFDMSWYEKEFTKLGIPKEPALNLTNSIVSSFYSLNEPFLSHEALTADEKSHLQDVRHLMQFVLFLIPLFAVAFVLLIRKMSLSLVAKSCIVAGISAVLILLLTILVPFESLFNTFHAVLFPQGNWQFSETSLLLFYYPEAFWIDAATRWFTNSFVLSLLSIIVGAVILFSRKQKRKRLMRIYSR